MEHKPFLLPISAMLIALLIVGCSSPAPSATPVPPQVTVASPTVAPIAATARPTVAPAQPTAAPTTAASPSANYNGEWKGNTSTDSPLSFVVGNNQVTFITVNYNGPAGTCQSLSLSYAQSLENMPIKGRDFSAQAAFNSGDQVALAGLFTSNIDATGSFTIKGKLDSCGDFEVKGTFSAKNGRDTVASAPMPSNPAPTGDSASKTLRAFFAVINAKNVDAALALVDDTITFNIASTTGVGKAALKTYLQGQIGRGVTYTVSNLDDQGDSVSLSLKTGNGAATDDNTASFDDDGKIDFMVFK